MALRSHSMLSLARGAIALLGLLLGLPPGAAWAQFRIDRPNFFEDGQQQFEQEIRRLEQQRPNIPPTLTLEAGEGRWSRVVLRAAGCAVWLPEGTLAQETETLATPFGELNFTVIASHPPGSRFVIAASEPLPSPGRANPEQLLAQVRDRVLSRAPYFTLAGQREVVFKSYQARDFMLHSEEETLTFRLLLAQDRLYVLAVRQGREAAALEAIAAYFGSFELL